MPLFQRPWLMGLGALATLSLVACKPGDPMLETTTALADGTLLPAYQQWHDHNAALAASARAFCAGEQGLQETRTAYAGAQSGWAHLQPMLVGPFDEGNLAWQVQFWPDKKNLVARQVNALLKQHPQLTTAQVESGSVVVQGLTAYEYVLFDPAIDLTDDATRARYCPLLVAIGQHQERLASDVLGLWQGDAGLAAKLRAFPNDRYADTREALGDLLRVDVTALDALKKKLGLPLGRPGQGIPQPYQAEAWRSQRSLASIADTLAGAEALWQGPEGKGLRALLPAEQKPLADSIDRAFADVRGQLAALDRPLAELLADDAGRARLNALYDGINTLHRLHQGDLAKALNVQIGFNAHDGD